MTWTNIFKSQDAVTLIDILDLMSDQYYQFSLFKKMPFDASKIERKIFLRIVSFKEKNTCER